MKIFNLIFMVLIYIRLTILALMKIKKTQNGVSVILKANSKINIMFKDRRV